MGFLDLVKLIFLPAFIAGALYLFLAYIAIPLYRKHYTRYSSYIPLDTISSRTSDFRHQALDMFSRWLLPAHLRWRREIIGQRSGVMDDVYFGDEEGESLVGFDVGRRERLPRIGREERVRNEERLSRDLEEGFRDSDESGEEALVDDRRT